MLYLERMRARSDVCELFAKNVSHCRECGPEARASICKELSRIERCLWVQLITFVSRYIYHDSIALDQKARMAAHILGKQKQELPAS